MGVGAALVLAVVARLAVGSGQRLPQMDAGVAPTPASGAPVLRSAPDLASAIALPSDEPPPKPRTPPDLASAIIVPE